MYVGCRLGVSCLYIWLYIVSVLCVHVVYLVWRNKNTKVYIECILFKGVVRCISGIYCMYILKILNVHCKYNVACCEYVVNILYVYSLICWCILRIVNV